MKPKFFSTKDLEKLYKPVPSSTKEDNGQVTIIGGSSLFHGAPLLALKTASRIVDMVFFASPEPSIGKVAEKIKSQLGSFIWIPLGEVEYYIKKCDAILIGPGFMRFRNEKDKRKAHSICDEACQASKKLTERLLRKFPDKRWVIDGGSLQTMRVECIPPGAILTPNLREFIMLFGGETNLDIKDIKDTGGIKEQVKDTSDGGRMPSSEVEDLVKRLATKYNCTIVLKTPITVVCSPEECVLVKGGNAGLTKGGTGDVQAGLTVALAAKNEPMLAACAASYIIKKAGESLAKKVGFAYNADDLAAEVVRVLGKSGMIRVIRGAH